MTALIVTTIIISAIVAVFYIPIYADIVLGEENQVEAGWLFLKFQVFPQIEKPEKEKKKKTTQKRKTTKKATTEEKTKTKTTSEDFAAMLGIIKSSINDLKAYFKALLKALNIRKLQIDWKIGGEDAAEIALSYGKNNAIFYTTYAVIATFIDIKPKKIMIYPDFVAENSKINAKFRVNIIPAKVISATFGFGINMLIKFLKNKNKNEKAVVNNESTSN
ncbi:MAG: DUF2953 domain-containing protein [Oscillospiraceae bacterium]